MKFFSTSGESATEGQRQTAYEFAGFRLDPGQRTLTQNGEPVALGPKVFDVLLFLVRNRGRVLEKNELMKALWPESFVEESNLSQNIFVLRKVLGGHQNRHSFIKTIPRRGYQFIASVKQLNIPAHEKESSWQAEYWSQHNPFRGLEVFEPEDSALFFGRDLEIEDLLVRLGRSPTLVVIGNSGCGKSSLIRAGIIPALRAGRFLHWKTPVDSWRVALFRPSGAPFDYLTEVLSNQLAPEWSLEEQAEFVADCRSKLLFGGEALHNAIDSLATGAALEARRTHILLIADQFEELFTLTPSREVRERYIDMLLAASVWNATVPIHLMLVLSADYYPYCLEHSGLRRCLESNLYNVPSMTRHQLREAIEKRLALAGAHAESSLIDSLLNEVGTEPGNLALLEQALSQLWKKCGGFGCTLTNQTYSAIGRLRGVLSVHAALLGVRALELRGPLDKKEEDFLTPSARGMR